ncbi:hypothetical protein BD289DRAFT_244999 [Coniella lustricola]|uniref:RRM domain-containing protein n=1 Tax=Coniella lustricola TaxID=2025994 RepID=A0A2T3A951_9PEZI|nr:hypothetical protein BD289DRAFT_244999 [Coniella lustricola]
MSTKLNQSLEEILKTNRAAGRGRGGHARRSTRPAKVAAPTGGVKKNVKPAGKTTKQAPNKAAKGPRGSQIQMSNLPKDVSETQIKEYFAELNKDTKKGPVGTVVKLESFSSGSRNMFQVAFRQSDGAYKALERLKDIKIDNKPIDVKILVSGDAIPEPPTLSQRVTNAPKPTAIKAAPKAKKAAVAGGGKDGKKGRGGRAKNARPAKKTADELDAEMADYFDAAKASAEGAGGAAGGNGDAQMEDEIM